MAHTIYCGKIAKRKNSTYQPTGAELATTFDVLLKSPTSLHTPTFTISAASFDFNYIKWGDRYYFVTDVVSRNNNLWEVSAVCDVLATFKSDIIASTQFVSYSSHKTSDWLADTRIPVQKNETVSKNSSTMNFLFNTTGFYVLSVVGENGCVTYACDQSHIEQLIQNVSQWRTSESQAIDSGLPVTSPVTVEEFLSNLDYTVKATGVLGNAYSDAPNCIRSCIWVPFFANFFTGIGSQEIHLGAFPTGVTTFKCKATPVTRDVPISIPWQFNDWRRSVCEEIYLYLPMVGMVSIPSDEIINESSINVQWSATATDGCIAYKVTAGNQVIGTYGANASANYAIGISQQASAGEIVQSVISGAQKTVAAGIAGKKTAGLGGAIAGTALGAVGAAYDISDTAMTKHNSCIGGIGGGAGCGLDLDLECFSVAHPTSTSPASMVATMGYPTMQPMTLSTLSGYCECANAHVAANGAESQELDEIDAFLNGGFYIE